MYVYTSVRIVYISECLYVSEVHPYICAMEYVNAHCSSGAANGGISFGGMNQGIPWFASEKKDQKRDYNSLIGASTGSKQGLSSTISQGMRGTPSIGLSMSSGGRSQGSFGRPMSFGTVSLSDGFGRVGEGISPGASSSGPNRLPTAFGAGAFQREGGASSSMSGLLNKSLGSSTMGGGTLKFSTVPSGNDSEVSSRSAASSGKEGEGGGGGGSAAGSGSFVSRSPLKVTFGSSSSGSNRGGNSAKPGSQIDINSSVTSARKLLKLNFSSARDTAK